MKIRRRIKRTTKQYFIVAFICIVVIGGAAIFTSVVLTGQIREEYQTLLTKANADMRMNQRNVYVATIDIMRGDYVTAEKVEKRTVYASQPEETYITATSLGKIAMVDIFTGTHLINSMLTENAVSSELREFEYNVIYLSSNIIKNDSVDIRIFYPNGESYVVLSKKVMQGIMPETATCYLWLDEEELLRMSAAIVDAGLYPGTKLSVTKYIEPNIQQASTVTYTPSLSILTLLENNPNIVQQYSQELSKEVRKALENRLAESMGTDVSGISWDINLNSNLLPKITPLPLEESTLEPTLTPTQAPPQISEDVNAEETNENNELGSTSDYLFYAEEENTREDDIEYGE